MKRWILWILWWTLSLGVQAEVTMSRAGSPRIQFEKTVYDFGATSRVENVTGSFTFRNEGDAELKLETPRTTCGCTVATLKAERIKPGQQGEILFAVSMPSVRSKVDQQIVVRSNDPNRSEISLTVQGQYVPLFEIEPILLRFEARTGETTNLVALVRRTDGKPLNLTKIEPSQSWIKARIAPAESQNDEARIRIEATPQGHPRFCAEWVRIFVDNMEEPVLTAALMGRVLGDVRVEPEMLLWSVNASPALAPLSEGSLSRRLRISSTMAGPPLEVRGLVSTIKEVEVELITEVPGKSYELVVKLAQLPKMTTKGMIKFKTNFPSQPIVDVPVTIIVAGP